MVKIKIVTARTPHPCGLNTYDPDSTCFEQIDAGERAVMIKYNPTDRMAGGWNRLSWTTDYLHCRCYRYLTQHRPFPELEELSGFNQKKDAVPASASDENVYEAGPSSHGSASLYLRSTS